MLSLAKDIIGTKTGTFDPRTFDDRHDAALAELVKAKMEGKALPKRKAVKVEKVNDLMEALRMSAGVKEDKASSKGETAKAAARKTARSTKPAPKPSSTPQRMAS